MTTDNDLILYHYSFSPYALRITWYLTLRGINYAQCMQPPILPRPDVHSLGINYRRIPLLAMGRDVYCDTRLILRKLEEKFPEGALSASQPDHKALQSLLDKWTVETVFPWAAQLIPSSLPIMQDPKFQQDRKDFSGANWDKDSIEAARPEALIHIRDSFAILETTLLADGRDWILKTDKPSLADIQAVWLFYWLNGLKGALPRELISHEQFPRVFAWIQRFHEAIKEARDALRKPTTLKGDAARARILSAKLAPTTGVRNNDPSGLGQGQVVEVWPIDTGFRHKDRGTLVSLDDDEIVIEVKAKDEIGEPVQVHFPRLNYRIRGYTDHRPEGSRDLRSSKRDAKAKL